jgi:hypothetical protein
MSQQTLAQKLQIKPGRKILLLNPPAGFPSMLEPLPEGAVFVHALEDRADLVQVFVANRQELEAWLGKIKAALPPNGILWICYHKGTSKIKTDIHRDSINDYARSLGMEGIAVIAIDDDWAALRLKFA